MRLHWIAGLVLLGGVAGSFAACGSSIVDTEPDTSALVTLEEQLLPRFTEVVVLVADDAPTADAEALRAEVLKSVRAGLSSAQEERWTNCHSPDPAQWHPGDVRVVVVRPSAPDDVAVLSPAGSPDLAWVTRMSFAHEIEPVVAATEAALNERLALPGEAFRPLHAARRALELISGSRAPETDSEAAFIASLPADVQTWVLVAATRDDEDPAPAADFFLDERTKGQLVRFAVVGPFDLASGLGCEPLRAAASTRLEAWGDHAGMRQVYAWPCDALPYWDSIFSHCCVECYPRCHGSPIDVSPDGSTACHVFIDQKDLDQCDAGRGWRDPDGKPSILDGQGGKVRRCEIVQLTGADLQACRTTLDCSGCEGGGFCATVVPELDLSDRCGGEHFWPLRFVGGALDAPGGRLSMTCLTKGM